jgi:hypothetical protein
MPWSAVTVYDIRTLLTVSCHFIYCCTVVPAGTASLFCCNPFIDAYLHMLVAALELCYTGQGQSSKISVFTRLPRKQRGRWYMVKHLGDQQSRDPSADSESVVL